MEQKNEVLQLKNQLSFPLYVCSKELVRLYVPHLERLGLTYTQYITMMVIWEFKGLYAKQIGQTLYLDSGTLTPVLKRLEDKGWITRSRSMEDERNLWVALTPEGEAAKEKAMEIPALVADSIGFTEEESDTLRTLLYKLMEQIH